jgi:hypothetical protein
VHNGGHILDGKIVTGHLLHDCFVPVGREKCIFAVTGSGDGDIAIVGTGALTVTSGTATVSNGASSITVAGGEKNVTVSTVSGGVDTAMVTTVASSDESVLKAVYNPDAGKINVTPLKAGTANLVVTANGRTGYTSPANVTVAFTVTAT